MIFAFGDFEFDDARLELRQAGKVVKSEATAKRLLGALIRRAGEVVTKDELVDQVWDGRAVADNVITVAMTRLRRALSAGGAAQQVFTVYGRGYRFASPLTMRETPDQLGLARAGAADRSRPLFVGRERVIERLERALADARRGSGRVSVLMGEAGIGKTRAVEALEQKLSNTQVRVAWGFCREAGDTPPLWPWQRLLREVVATTMTTGRAQQLAPAVSELSELLRPLAARSEARDGSPARENHGFAGAARHRSFDMFARIFAEAAQVVPWVLVLDDLHRADAASLELLGYLIDEIAGSRLLIVATLRHAPGRRAPRPETPLPYVLGHRNCERIALAPLRQEEVAAYVASLIDDADGSVTRSVFAKSEGNPFFMTELSRQLRSGEPPAPEALAIPDVALELIRQRVAKLDKLVRDVLAAAAVIGRTFELSLLQAVTGQASSCLMASLDDAVAQDLVGAAPESTTAFAFGHDLMRAVLYDALAPAERRRWHVRTAEALERRMLGGEPVPPSELAYHLHAALPDSDLRKTVQFCRAASAAAASVYANADVVRYLRHALEALGLMENPSVRLRISLWYTITLYGRGQPAAEFVRWTGEVVRLAQEHGDAPMLARAALVLNAYPGFKPIPGARAALDHAHGSLPPEAVGARAVTLAALACTAPYCFDATRSRALLAEALPLARSSASRAVLYVALVVQLYLEGGPRHAREAGAAADELAHLQRSSPTPEMAVAPLYVALYRAVSALQSGAPQSIASAIELGLAHAREIRNTLSWHFERFRLLSQINQGAWSVAIPALVALHRRAEQQSILGTEPFCAFDRIVIFAEIADGDVPVLDDALRSALDYDASEPPSIWAMKVRALSALGLLDEARAALHVVAPSELGRLPCDSQYLGTLGHLARAALRLEASDYMEALYPLLARYPEHFSGHFSFLCEGSVPQLLGMLSAALGRHADALTQLELGAQMNERAGFALRAAEARLAWASCALDRGQPSQRTRARSLVRDACRAAARVGLRALGRKTHLALKSHEAAK